MARGGVGAGRRKGRGYIWDNGGIHHVRGSLTLYIMFDVAVFFPFFFHSFTCAIPRNMSDPGIRTEGAPPDTGPSFSIHAATPLLVDIGRIGVQIPVSGFSERTSRGSKLYSR